MFNSVHVQQMHITLELGTGFYTVTWTTWICQKDFLKKEAKNKPGPWFTEGKQNLSAPSFSHRKVLVQCIEYLGMRV